MKDRTAWVIFDADNTLWAVEQLYDDAREKLCRFLGEQGADAGAAERYQQARDKALHGVHGYSAGRFGRSLEDTLRHFLPGATDQHLRFVRSLAADVFEQRARPATGLLELLDSLSGYSLGIITAGERWVQERRLQQFELRHRFEAVDIVDFKTVAAFDAFCERHGVARERSWMVGDSLKSDVLPARAAGLKAILLRTHNWDLVEAGGLLLPDDVPAVDSLMQVREIIRARA